MGTTFLPSQALQDAVRDIMVDRVESIYLIDCEISGSNYDLTVDWFIGMALVRDFANSYTDYISVSIDIRPRDLLDLINNYQDLTCTIILRPVCMRTCYEYMDREPIIFSGRVCLTNPQDLLKKYNLRQLIADEEAGTPSDVHQSMKLRLEFQVMDQQTYDLRHKKVNAMFTNTSLDKVLYYVAEQFGFSKSAIAKPENKDTLTNLVIPPGHDISTIFHFLQERYGVFSKGMRSYISDGTLHVYGGYDVTAPGITSVWEIIKAPDQYLAGDVGYHKKVGDDLYIVSNGGGDISNLTESGVEQEGNSQLTMQADRVVDHSTAIDSSGKIKINENIQNLKLTTDHQAQNKAVNTRYTGETVNSFNSLSNMSQYDAVMAVVTWVNAEPILASPGQKVKLHYDDDGYYATAEGILESMSYTSQPQQRSLDKPFFSFQGVLQLRLKPDPRTTTSSS